MARYSIHKKRPWAFSVSAHGLPQMLIDLCHLSHRSHSKTIGRLFKAKIKPPDNNRLKYEVCEIRQHKNSLSTPFRSFPLPYHHIYMVMANLSSKNIKVALFINIDKYTHEKRAGELFSIWRSLQSLIHLQVCCIVNTFLSTDVILHLKGICPLLLYLIIDKDA